MKRVLIIKIGAIGDLVMATPMLTALHAANPNIEVSWLVDRNYADLLRGVPFIHRIIGVEATSWTRDYRRGRIVPWLRTTVALQREICRDGPVDAVICAHAEENRWWPFVKLGDRRIGLHPSATLARRKARKYNATFGRPSGRTLHNIDHYLLATQALGCPDASRRPFLGENDDESQFASEFVERHGFSSSRPTILLAPFTTWQSKAWDGNRWIELIEWLVSELAAQVVVTMGADDASAAHSLNDAVSEEARQSVALAAGTTLRQYVGLIRRSDLVVSLDSSALHIAAAVGTPFVALFGPTKIAEIVPLDLARGAVLNRVLPCSPCNQMKCVNPIDRQCMLGISVLDVRSEIRRLLDVSMPSTLVLA